MNPTSGVNVISPLTGSTVHVPSFGIVADLPSGAITAPGAVEALSSTVVGSRSLFASVSFPTVFSVTGCPTTPVSVSSTATGGTVVNATTVGSSSTGELSSERSVTGVPSGSSPVAVAWLLTFPSTISLAVNV